MAFARIRHVRRVHFMMAKARLSVFPAVARQLQKYT